MTGDPFPTREIPRIPPQAARPAGYLPPTAEVPFVRPVPPAPYGRSPAQQPQPEPTDAGFELLLPERLDPRSRSVLHLYGPAIFVGGAFALVVALILLLLRVLGAL